MDRNIAQPRPGYFKVRQKRGGPWIPAQITEPPPLDPESGEILDRSTPFGFCMAFINDQPTDIWNVWIYGHPITKDEWQWLTALQAIRSHNP